MKAMNYLKLELLSERIKLVPISMTYATEICMHFTTELTRYMWPSGNKTQDEINQHILLKQAQMKNGEEIALLIIKQESSEFLGYISIHQVNSKTPELGIWLKKSAHGFSYGYEALTLLKNWAECHLHYDYLKYPVDKKNIVSMKLAKKLGGGIEDKYKKMSESGNVLDEVEYRFYQENNNG